MHKGKASIVVQLAVFGAVHAVRSVCTWWVGASGQEGGVVTPPVEQFKNMARTFCGGWGGLGQRKKAR